MTKDQRRDFQEALARQGRGNGLLFYDAGKPIAWCQVGPAEGFPRYDRSRLYASHAMAKTAQSRPLWRIMCVFVDKDRRGAGLSRVVLRGALTHIAEQGGGIVEVFPLDVAGVETPQYSGTIRLYESEGFKKVARLGASTVLMRKTIRARRK